MIIVTLNALWQTNDSQLVTYLISWPVFYRVNWCLLIMQVGRRCSMLPIITVIEYKEGGLSMWTKDRPCSRICISELVRVEGKPWKWPCPGLFVIILAVFRRIIRMFPNILKAIQFRVIGTWIILEAKIIIQLMFLLCSHMESAARWYSDWTGDRQSGRLDDGLMYLPLNIKHNLKSNLSNKKPEAALCWIRKFTARNEPKSPERAAPTERPAAGPDNQRVRHCPKWRENHLPRLRGAIEWESLSEPTSSTRAIIYTSFDPRSAFLNRQPRGSGSHARLVQATWRAGVYKHTQFLGLGEHMGWERKLWFI